MSKDSIKNEVVLKDHPNQLSSAQMRQQLSSKLHQCALIWSDKCAHCEIGFDALKQQISSSTEPTDENLNELSKAIEECLDTLEGIHFLLIYLFFKKHTPEVGEDIDLLIQLY
jgi:hypothetical protein